MRVGGQIRTIQHFSVLKILLPELPGLSGVRFPALQHPLWLCGTTDCVLSTPSSSLLHCQSPDWDKAVELNQLQHKVMLAGTQCASKTGLPFSCCSLISPTSACHDLLSWLHKCQDSGCLPLMTGTGQHGWTTFWQMLLASLDSR